MKIPGVVWITAITLLATTLGPWIDQYVGKPWGPLIVILLGVIAKCAEVYLEYLKEQHPAVTPPAILDGSVSYTAVSGIGGIGGGGEIRDIVVTRAKPNLAQRILLG